MVDWFGLLAEYKAASLYVDKSHTPCEIAQLLNINEITVKYWIDKNRWDAARLVAQAPNTITTVINDFCDHFKSLLPKNATEVEFVKHDYLKNKL